MGDGGGEGKGFSVPIGPAVVVGIFRSVEDAVAIGVRVGGIGDGAGGLAGSVVAQAKRANSGNRAGIFHYGVKGRIHVPDEVFVTIGIGVGGDIGAGVRGGAPSHFEGIGQAVPIGIRTTGECFAKSVVYMDIPVRPRIGARFREIFDRGFVDITQSVVVAIRIRGTRRFAQDDPCGPGGGRGSASIRTGGGQLIVAGSGDHPRDVPNLRSGIHCGSDSVPSSIAIGIDQRRLFVGIPNPIRVEIRKGVPRVVDAILVVVEVGFCRIKQSVEVGIGVGFVQDCDGGISGQDHTVDRKAGLHLDGEAQTVRPR